MSFSTAHPSLRRALAAKAYTEPTPVQAAIMAPETDGKDLLVSAQTGSGKTVAFGLALATKLLGEGARFTAQGAPRALIVAPTRELAQQVHRELSWLYAETGARITTCVGGMDPRRETQALHHGVHIVVGTPGRLCDHLERKNLVLSKIEAIVLDEADEMLDMGFREDLERLLDAAPAERRTLMFSATIPREIATLAKRYQKNALRIATATEGDRHRDIEYQAVPIIPRERDLAVVNLLRYHDAPGSLVFCATRDGVTRLAANLNERGFKVAALSGELSQRERNQALQALRDGRARVCVATDVAARGLDLPDLGLVIHADLPQNKQVLVHRSGRTGRAGRKGIAILVVPDAARRFADRLFAAAGIEATWKAPPSSDDIRIRDQDQLVLEIRALADEPTEDDRQVAKTLLAERTAEQLVAALAHLRRQARPAPEELTPPPSMKSRGPVQWSERPQRPMTKNDRPPLSSRPQRPAPGPRNDRPPRPAPEPSERADGPAPGARSERPDRPAHGARDDRPAFPPRDRSARAPSPANGARPAFPPASLRPDRPARTERPAFPVPDERPGRTARLESAPAPDPAMGGPRTGGEAVWFTVNVGRSKNADPKWLVPLLCRRGGITKNAIGKIQILARETRVEIAGHASEKFAVAVREPDTKDRNIHIEPLDHPP